MGPRGRPRRRPDRRARPPEHAGRGRGGDLGARCRPAGGCGARRPPPRSWMPGRPGSWSGPPRSSSPSWCRSCAPATPGGSRSASTSGVGRWPCGAGTRGAATDVVEVAGRFASVGVAALIVTQIGQDGDPGGPGPGGLALLLGAVELPLVASGGVGTLDDLRCAQHSGVRWPTAGRRDRRSRALRGPLHRRRGRRSDRLTLAIATEQGVARVELSGTVDERVRRSGGRRGAMRSRGLRWT